MSTFISSLKQPASTRSRGSNRNAVNLRRFWWAVREFIFFPFWGVRTYRVQKVSVLMLGKCCERSEERRVGKEGGTRWAAWQWRKKRAGDERGRTRGSEVQ